MNRAVRHAVDQAVHVERRGRFHRPRVFHHRLHGLRLAAVQFQIAGLCVHLHEVEAGFPRRPDHGVIERKGVVETQARLQRASLDRAPAPGDFLQVLVQSSQLVLRIDAAPIAIEVEPQPHPPDLLGFPAGQQRRPSAREFGIWLKAYQAPPLLVHVTVVHQQPAHRQSRGLDRIHGIEQCLLVDLAPVLLPTAPAQIPERFGIPLGLPQARGLAHQGMAQRRFPDIPASVVRIGRPGPGQQRQVAFHRSRAQRAEVQRQVSAGARKPRQRPVAAHGQEGQEAAARKFQQGEKPSPRRLPEIPVDQRLRPVGGVRPAVRALPRRVVLLVCRPVHRLLEGRQFQRVAPQHALFIRRTGEAAFGPQTRLGRRFAQTERVLRSRAVWSLREEEEKRQPTPETEFHSISWGQALQWASIKDPEYIICNA